MVVTSSPPRGASFDVEGVAAECYTPFDAKSEAAAVTGNEVAPRRRSGPRSTTTARRTSDARSGDGANGADVSSLRDLVRDAKVAANVGGRRASVGSTPPPKRDLDMLRELGLL